MTTDRRTFLRAAGGTGAAAALANLRGVRRDSDENDGVEELPASIRRVIRGEVLVVGVTASGSMAAVEEALPAPAEVTMRQETLRFLRVDLSAVSSDAERLRVQSAIASHPDVKYTEPDRPVRSASVGSVEPAADPLAYAQYAPDQVRADQAATRGADDVTIAVIDTGIDYEHPDLAPQFDDDPGTDFVHLGDDDPAPARPDEEHGTHVAGIAAGKPGNREGIAGISDASLLSCRVLDGTLLGAIGAGSALADAIVWATDNGADVINMSLGGAGSTGIKAAVQYAVANGVLPVAAAGNDFRGGVSYPAAYDEVVAVSALDEFEDLATFSNVGPEVDLAAPGVDVFSSVPADQSYEYGYLSGTSMASPVVAGVAALTSAAHPDLSPEQLRSRLERTAVSVGLDDEEQGSGRVDAPRAIGQATGPERSPPSAVVSASTRDPAVGEEVVFRANRSSDDGHVDTYRWEIGDRTVHGERVTHTFREAGEATVRLTVVDDVGKRDTATQTVTVGPDVLETLHEQTTLTGSIDGDDGPETHSHRLSSDRPTRLAVELNGVAGERLTVRQERVADPQGGTTTFREHGRRRVELDAAELHWLDADRPITIEVEGSGGVLSGYEIVVEEYTVLENDPPLARISLHPFTETEAGEPVTFVAEAVDLQFDAMEYEWSFGDGTTATGGTLVDHTYDVPGEYTVELTVTDEHGASTTTSKTVDIGGNHPPSAVIDVGNRPVGVGATVTLDGSGSRDPDGTVTGHRWEVGDRLAYGERIQHTFGKPGKHDVSLTVIDDDGTTTTATTTVEVVDNEAPTVAIDGATDVAAPGEVVELSADASDPDGDAVEYEWSLGDGTTTAGATVTHSYADSGSYKITLEATDEHGATATASEVVTVGGGDRVDGTTFEGTLDAGELVQHAYPVPSAADSVVLELDAATDHDLFVSLDGGSATPEDADRASRSAGGTERIVVDDPREGEIGIGVLALAPGEYTVTVSARQGDGDACGGTSTTETMSGFLLDIISREDHLTYTGRLADPCRLSLSLSGPDHADFDLFLRRDGEATPENNDRSAASTDSEEQLSLGEIDAGETVHLLVRTYGGSGAYTLTATEVGSGDG